MNTKEEIRAAHLYKNGLSVTKSKVGEQIQKAAYGAMDEYAKQEAIEFTLWVGLNGYSLNIPSQLWFKSDDYEFIPTEQLWDMYQSSKTDQK